MSTLPAGGTRRCLNNRSVLFRIYRNSPEGLEEVLRKPFLGIFGLFKPRLRGDVVEDAFESPEFLWFELPSGEVPLHSLPHAHSLEAIFSQFAQFSREDCHLLI